MLRDFRKRLGLSLEDMSERTGFSVSQLSRWEAGDNNIPSQRLPDLARHYECRINEIFADDGTPFVPLGASLYVKGVVAAGVWREAEEMMPDEWETFTGRADITAPLRDRFGLRVEGDSMNEIYPSGTIIECIYYRHEYPISSGKRVVVRRRRSSGEFETTVKEYVRDSNGIEWLVPRSSNPSFQRPFRVDDGLDDDVIECEIIGIVVASIRPE